MFVYLCELNKMWFCFPYKDLDERHSKTLWDLRATGAAVCKSSVFFLLKPFHMGWKNGSCLCRELLRSPRAACDTVVPICRGGERGVSTLGLGTYIKRREVPWPSLWNNTYNVMSVSWQNLNRSVWRETRSRLTLSLRCGAAGSVDRRGADRRRPGWWRRWSK